MALKILLADDSMTAQNLGKKILADAGYEVVAVSNGAAAVKRIASEKPDMVILDVYMPGYSGLEVCEKIKASAATAKLPVLLTVGKMEPYQAEDGNRVKADGVMIKPFEASDLLAVVEKFTKKGSATAEPTYTRTQKMTAVEDFKDESYEAWKSEAPMAGSATGKQVAMPDGVGSAPAFGFEEHIAPAHAPSAEIPVVATPRAEGEAPAFDMAAEAAAALGFEMPGTPATTPAFDLSPATGPAMPVDLSPVAEPAPAFDLAPNAAEPAPAFGLNSEEPAPTAEIAIPPELEFNSAPPVEVAAAQAPELESTMMATPPDAPVVHDPALVTNTDVDISSFVVKIGVENPEPVPVGIAEPAPSLEEEMAAAIPTIEPPEDVPTQKIDALVDEVPAARVVEIPGEAMSAVEAPAKSAEDHFVPAASAMSLEEEMRRAFSGLPVETAPATQAAAAAAGAASAPAMGVDVGAVAQATGTDEDRVAQALDRVMQRFKGELISEIVRELKKS